MEVCHHLTFRTGLDPSMAGITDTQNDEPCSEPQLDAIKS